MYRKLFLPRVWRWACKAVSGIVLAAVFCLLSFPAVAMAEPAPLSEEQSVALLRGYGIVRGEPGGNLWLDRRLSRAEAAVIFIRSRGADSMAQMLADDVPFMDARGHWAAGEITLAERLGLMRGDGNDRFRPNDEITYAEVLTVLLRMVQQEPAGAWDPYGIWAAAKQAGIAPAGQLPSAPAVRGRFFWSLGNAIARIQLPSGLTVLQTYVDGKPPEIRLDQAAIQTRAETVTVSGRAPDAVQVSVGGKAASFDRASGIFRAEVSLQVGANLISVEAVDAAGNKAGAEVSADRAANIASLRIEGPAMIQANSRQKLTVTATDPRGQSMPLDGVKAEVTGNLGLFDVTTGTLAVGEQTGRGTLTLRYEKLSATYTFTVTGLSSRAAGLQVTVQDGDEALTVLKEVQVKVQVVDAGGQVLTDDFWRTVTLRANGGVLDRATAVTSEGVATFKLTPSEAETLTLRAFSEGLPDAQVSLPVYTGTRVVLSASSATLPPDGVSTATIRAALEDEKGRRVTNSSRREIVITLAITGGSDGELTSSRLTIPAGASASAGAGVQFRAGIQPSRARITGRDASGHDYTITPVTVASSPMPGVRLAFSPKSGTAVPGSQGTLIEVQVLDNRSRLVTAGSYAFQLTAATSTGDAAVNGLPPGVKLTLEGTGYQPVYDGRAPGDPGRDPMAVVGRTYQGKALLRLAYDRSGVITLTPVLVGPKDGAYNPASGYGLASGSAGMAAEPFEVSFAGVAAQVRLTADSALGKAVTGGAGVPGATFRLRAQVVDANGAPVSGYNKTITLRRVAGQSVTSISGSASQTAANGVAEFVVKSTGHVGFDQYTASAVNLSGSRLTLSVRNQAPQTPVIVAVRGSKTEDPSPETGRVGPDADYLDIQLAHQQSEMAGEPGNWMQARVFRKGESSPIFTGPVDLAADWPTVRVPKSSLKRGEAVYQVSVQNGYAESGRSLDLGTSQALNVVYGVGYGIKSAWFDAATGRLFLAATGLESTGLLSPAKLTIAGGTEQLPLDDPAVSAVSISSAGAVIDLGDLKDLVRPDLFSGQVELKAAAGWYASRDGSLVSRENAGVPVKPMAVISYAMLDVPAGRLYLQGMGFSQGTFNLQLIQVEQGLTAVQLKSGTTSATDRVISTADNSIAIALSPATLAAIDALSGPEIHVTAQAGWLKVTYGSTVYSAGAVTGPNHGLYTRAVLTSVAFDRSTRTLTLRGSGFTGAVLNPARLAFKASGVTGWHPGAATSVNVKNDSTIQVVLSPTDATSFGTKFGGRSVFLNTDSGWLVDGKGRPAVPVSPESILFTLP